MQGVDISTIEEYAVCVVVCMRCPCTIGKSVLAAQVNNIIVYIVTMKLHSIENSALIRVLINFIERAKLGMKFMARRRQMLSDSIGLRK
jgi:hypothetical protein